MKTNVRQHTRKVKGRQCNVVRHQRSLKPNLGRVGLNRPFSKKKGIFHLPVRTAIIVPSTTSKDKKISREAFQKRINETRKFLSDKNGGYTSVRGLGGFTDDDTGRLIKEDVAIVESFATTDDFKNNKAAVEEFLKQKGKAWGQKSMGYQHEDDLYHVDS